MKILFSSPTKPFNKKYGDSFSSSANGAFQLTWAQKGFRAEDMMWHWGLDLIAINLEVPSTVLHFPTVARFTREIQRQYDYIGLTFNLATFHKIKKQVQLIRKFSPKSKIILGGYGTILPEEDISPWCDYICREEGIAFMRKLLGQKNETVRHPQVSISRKILSLSSGERTGIIFSSIGCPNGCDFCITSHYFKGKQIRFLDNGKQVYQEMMQMQDQDNRIGSFTIIDEDFLVDRLRGMQFLEMTRTEKRFFDVMIFSSIRSLSQFEAKEIAEMGITRIWLGFEAKKAGYKKLEGKDFARLVHELQEWGISVTVSMIIGYDYQTEDIAWEELMEVMRSTPVATQIMIFSPCYGTAAWNRLEKEERLIPQLKENYFFHDGYTLLYSHPEISFYRMNSLVREMSREEYKKLGPSIFRFLHISLASYEKLAKSENPVLKSRVALVPGRVKKARVLYPVGIVFAPSPEVRTALRKDFHQIIQMFGWLSIREILLSAVAFVLYAWSSLRFRFSWNIQPKSIVKEYRCGDENPTGYPQKAAVSTEDGISQKTALRTTSTHYIGSTGSCRTDDRF